MNVLIEVYSEVDKQLDGVFRGESLWPINMAKALAKHGHHVAMITHSPGHLLAPTIAAGGIILYNSKHRDKLVGQSFDACFQQVNALLDDPNDREKWKGIKIKKHIFGYFAAASRESVGVRGNEILVRPGSLQLSNDPHISSLPIPLGTFGTSKFKNRKVLWTAKDAIIQHSEGLAVANGVGQWVAGVQLIQDRYQNVEMVGLTPHEVQLADKLISCPKSSIKKKNEFSRHLSTFSVTVPMRWSGSLLDSIFAGCVPLFTKEWLDGYISQEVLHHISKGRGVTDFTKESVAEEIDLLLNDELEFNRRLRILRSALAPHTDECVVNQFENLVEMEQ